MNLTAAGDKKKIVILIAILVIGGGLVWYENSSDDTPAAPAAVRPAMAPAPSITTSRGPAAAERRRISSRNVSNEFQPRLGPRTPEERRDPATVDPTIRLDLLTKVQAVELGAPGRNLFDFGAAPAPMPAVPKNVPTIAINRAPATPPPPPPPPGPPPAPTAPPMNFKYYGFKVSSSDGHKAAFLLDGDDILVAGENDTFKRRYRVVKIGVNSIVIEDIQFRSTQTLTLQEVPAA